jgi:hypothetical protein
MSLIDQDLFTHPKLTRAYLDARRALWILTYDTIGPHPSDTRWPTLEMLIALTTDGDRSVADAAHTAIRTIHPKQARDSYDSSMTHRAPPHAYAYPEVRRAAP